MAKVELLLPKMGESVAEATVVKWLKQPGDRVMEDDAVLEVATDKVDSEVPSPVNGILVEIRCKEDDVMQVGDVLAIIETETDAEETPAAQKSPVETQPHNDEPPAASSAGDIPGMIQLTDREPSSQPAPAQSTGTRFYSPLVKSIAAEEGLSAADLENIPGTGSEGRVTREDILAYVRAPVRAQPAPESEEPARPEPAPVKPAAPAAQVRPPEPVQPPEPVIIPPPAPAAPGAKPRTEVPAQAGRGASDEIIEMDRMRRIIADHMVMSVQTSPHVCSFVEADVTNLVKWRERVKGAFEKREGEKLTFTPIFVEAVAKAIRDMPMINVSVEGTQIIKKKDINIGLAAALPSGNLIVPVIRHADQLNLTGLTRAVNDLAGRARSNRLLPDEIKEGTFTITNIGTFGNIMGTPIINQPQVAILAIGVIKKRPAVLETEHGDIIGIRQMTYLSLSYDHRVVDGALGGSFLRRIADYLEAWDPEREF